MGYIVIKVGGQLADGVRDGNTEGVHEFIGIAADSSLGSALAIRAARDYLDRLESNRFSTDEVWADAALDFAQQAGALTVALDTLSRSPAAVAMSDGSQVGVFPLAINDTLLIEELSEIAEQWFAELGVSPPEMTAMLRELLMVLHRKGLLP